MKNMPLTPRRTLTVAVAIALAGSPLNLYSAITVEDSFLTGGSDYVTGLGTLIGQGPTATGFTGNWLAAFGGADSPDVSNLGLTYSDGTNTLSAAGGSIEYSQGGNGRTGRFLANPITAATDGTVYFAFLMQLDSAAATDNYRGIEIHDGGFDDGANRQIQIVTGEPDAGNLGGENLALRLFNDSTNFRADLGAADTDVNLFVVKLTLGDQANEDNISIWRNPSDISSESASGPATATFSNFDIQFDRFSLARFNSANGFVADEVRFGTTWSDVTTVEDANDSDGDGLPDDWEISNNLGEFDDGRVNPDFGADGDPDLDGSSNLQEFTRGTDPRDEDSDDDRIFDGNETGTEIYVSPTNTGTDPLDPDSDDDGLNDNVETRTGVLVDLTDTGSDPNKSDTDADNVNDLSESVAGTNPSLASETPAPGDPTIVGLDFFDYPAGNFNDQQGGDFFDFDNSTANDSFIGHLGSQSQSSWFNSFGEPQIVCGTLQTANSGSFRALNGPATGGESISRFGNLPDALIDTFYFKIDLTYPEGNPFAGVSLFSGGNELLFFGVRGTGLFGAEEVGGNSEDIPGTTVTPTAGQTYTLVGVVTELEGDRFAKFFVDPNLALSEPDLGDAEIFPDNENNLYPSAIRIASGGDSPAIWDNLVVTTIWEALNTATPLDSDSDNLRDSYELAFTGDLTTLTSDSDNDDTDDLTNGQEQTAGTDPLNEDSDGDTISDSLEVTNGTNPCLLDTDGDGLFDNVENNSMAFVDENMTGTSPIDVDSDNDGLDDGFEVALGSDPTDGTKTPANATELLCNGYREDLYGSNLAVQLVQTEFGDNASELNAAFAGVQDGKLFLMLTGNIENNFNKLNILIDSSNAVTSNVLDAAGNDSSDVLDGMTLDTGFTPDYHVIVRRGFGATEQLDLDISNLATGEFASFVNVFGGTQEGLGNTGIPDNGTLTLSPIGVGYFNTNTAGVTGGNAAAVEADALAVVTGFELCIDLADIGSPSGEDIKAMAFVTSSDLTFASNQFLGALPVDLNGAGAGTSNLGTTSAIDLSAIAGDQCFSITIPIQPAGLAISECSLIGNIFSITATGLVTNTDYHVEFSPDLITNFVDVANSTFSASGETDTTSVTASETIGFYRIATGPAE